MNEIVSVLLAPGTLAQMLRSATPVALAAMGGAMTEHAGIMNIGMDGMILMGAFFAVLGSFLFGAASAGMLLTLGVGVLVGLLFGLLVVKLHSDEFIIGCALNTFALGLTGYLSDSIFGPTGAKGNPALPVLELPLLKDVPYVGNVLSGHSALFYIMLLLVVLCWLFVYKTPQGFWLRAAGEKPETLRTAGIDPAKLKWTASILCGLFCALAGADLSVGQLSGTFAKGMSNSRGYIAFACVIFASAHPGKAFLAALMFGYFDAVGIRLQRYVSADLTSMIPYLITVLMMIYVVVSRRRRYLHRTNPLKAPIGQKQPK